MSKLFGEGLTVPNSAVAYPGGAMSLTGPQGALNVGNQALQSVGSPTDLSIDNGVPNLTPNPRLALLPKIAQPSFKQASSDSAGNVTQVNKTETPLGKLLHILRGGLQGGSDAIAGGALDAPRQGQSPFGTGFGASMQLPIIRRQQQQAQQESDIQQQAQRQQLQMYPLQLQHTIADTTHLKALASQEQATANRKVQPPQDSIQSLHAAAVQDAIDNGRDPATDPKVLKYEDSITRLQKQTQPKTQTPEQQFIEDQLKQGKSLAGAIHDYATLTQKPEKTPQQLAVGPDGTVIALKPGMKVPQGTMSATAELGKPNADEQRRADLATNMGENLDQLEEIVKRRPDLFGPVAGRVTAMKQAFGTSDPDVSALSAIHEYLGMASVGAHSMRNAQHVGQAADAVMAGFKNTPAAILNAISTARKSTATFKQDLERSRGVSAPASTPAAPVTTPTTPSSATHAVIVNGVTVGYTSDGKTMTPVQ